MPTTPAIPGARAARVFATAVLALVSLAAISYQDAAGAGAAPPRAGTPGTPTLARQYGTPVPLGEGRARAYVVVDTAAGGRAVEVGVALDERAMDGLPAHGSISGAHGHYSEHLLTLPAENPTPFTFVELDWNPAGHGAPYEASHFDFHFYTVPLAFRDAIVPGDPQYLARAARDPAAAAVPASYANPVALLKAPVAAVAVPKMGMHWLDRRSPELQQALGKPDAYRPFTSTFIYGAWDGQFIFMEPMITRDHIVAKRDATDPAVRDEVVPISTSPTYPAGDFRPDAYRITHDVQAREYRIALVLLPRGA